MSMAEILILCHAISFYPSCLILTIFFKIKSALCTILTNVQTAFNLCWDSRSPLRALDQPVVEEVLLDVVQRGDVVALPQELLKLYSVFCILYSVLYILYSVLLYYVFCIFLVNRIKFRIFQYWDIVASPSFIFLCELNRVHIHKATDLQFLTKCQLVVWRDENIITLQVGSDHYGVRATCISKHIWNAVWNRPDMLLHFPKIPNTSEL